MRVEGLSLFTASQLVRIEDVWGHSLEQDEMTEIGVGSSSFPASPASGAGPSSGFAHPYFTSMSNPTGVHMRVLRWLEGTRHWKRRVHVSVDELEMQMPSQEMNTGGPSSSFGSLSLSLPLLSLPLR